MISDFGFRNHLMRIGVIRYCDFNKINEETARTVKISLGDILKNSFTNNWESTWYTDLSEKIYSSYLTINREEKLRKLLWKRVIISSQKRVLAWNQWKYHKDATGLKHKCNMLKKYIYKVILMQLQREFDTQKSRDLTNSSQVASTAMSLLSHSSSQPQYQKCERKAENPTIQRLYNDRFRKDEILKIKQQNAMDRETDGCTFKPELVSKQAFNLEKEVFDRLGTSYRKDLENLRKVERDILEMRECTFSPKLISKQLNRSNTSFSSLYEDSELRKHKLRTIQISELSKDLEGCTFQPEISPKSMRIIKSRPQDFQDVHDKLYNQHSETLRKRRTQEMHDITLRRSQTYNMNSSDVYDRLYQDAQQRKKSVEPRRSEDTPKRMENRSGSVPDRKAEFYDRLVRDCSVRKTRRLNEKSG